MIILFFCATQHTTITLRSTSKVCIVLSLLGWQSNKSLLFQEDPMLISPQKLSRSVWSRIGESLGIVFQAKLTKERNLLSNFTSNILIRHFNSSQRNLFDKSQLVCSPLPALLLH